MKKAVTAMLILAWALIPNLAFAEEEDDFAWLEHERIGELQLGMLADEVMAHMKQQPEKGTNEFVGATGEWVQNWTWKTAGVSIGMGAPSEKGQKTIVSITIKKPCLFRTRRWVGLGATEADVSRIYSDVASPEDARPVRSFVAGSVYGGVIFHFKNGKTTEIFLGAAAE